MQFVLSPQPARAHFLKPEERQWLQGRQDAQHKLSAERNPHQGKWWGERPSPTPPRPACKVLRTARLPTENSRTTCWLQHCLALSCSSAHHLQSHLTENKCVCFLPLSEAACKHLRKEGKSNHHLFSLRGPIKK